ncbi:hypothetical protein PLCT2_00136 [Planctomycetaceae bacterium]|nr:hypothetical protein PLCT2_00136 [Planctomycetaceae bacterium]
MPESNAVLLTRLKQLVQHMHQAEIARKTGASRNNVSRYLRGTKMPLEFGVALVKGLGVNPAWLLAGEGSPWLADVAAGTAKTAENLLSLVNAMAEVARMRLGSLAGKHHLKVLRELNDAMQHYETLRERLNKQTAPFFHELLDTYERALLSSEIERAEELRKALTQVSRLCDDGALARQFTRAQAYHEHFFGAPDKAIELQRKVLRIDLTTPGAVTSRMCSEAHNFALTLRGSGKLREARAICQAMQTLGRQAGVDKALLGLQYIEGSIDVALGELAEGLPKMTLSYTAMEPDSRARSQAAWLRALLSTDSLSLAQAFDLKPDLDSVAPMLLQYAVWLEDAALLERACKDCIGPGGRAQPSTLEAAQARTLLALLKKEKAPQLEETLARAQAQAATAKGARGRFLCVAPSIQLARVAGRRDWAIKRWREAKAALAELPPDIDVEIWHLATFWREAARINVQPGDAKAFFANLTKRGYNSYAAFA